jgi:integrase/recombinase XerC
MSTLPITEAFASYLTDERHFSPYTARCYGADLRQFIEYLVDDTGIALDEQAEREAFNKRNQSASGNVAPVAGSIGPRTITEVICAADADRIRPFLARLAEENYSAATMARRSPRSGPSTSGPSAAPWPPPIP